MSFSLPDTIYQILTPEGKLIDAPPDLPSERLLELYRWMVLGRVFSNRMVALQRQGRMGTFAPLNGQEAASVGLAAPLLPDDWLVASYREATAFMMKGAAITSIMEQWGGYLPDNYSLETNCMPIQVVLASQMHHAVGVAMALQYKKKPNAVVGVCGDGATSEGDFNEALNFAGAFHAPLVTVGQNNGWAISVPRQKQTAAKFIAHRGAGFGMPGYVVDGNDILAVYKIVSACVERARAGEGPSLIELITYRMGAHTTADDPTKYRPPKDLEIWKEKDPITRFQLYLREIGLLNQEKEEAIEADVRAEIQTAVDTYETERPAQQASRYFDMVFNETPPQLQRQHDELMQFLNRE